MCIFFYIGLADMSYTSTIKCFNSSQHPLTLPHRFESSLPALVLSGRWMFFILSLQYIALIFAKSSSAFRTTSLNIGLLLED